MSRRRILTLALLASAWLALAAPARAAREALLERAERAYAEGQYEAAVAHFTELHDGGLVHEELLYNLGNAWFLVAQGAEAAGKTRPDALGRAILAWERALALAPDFEDARFNLEVARDAVTARFGRDDLLGVVAESLWTRAVKRVPLAVLAWSVLALDLLFFAALIGLRFLPSGFARSAIVVVTIGVGSAGLLFAVLLFGQMHHLRTVRESVIVADEVVLRERRDPTSRELPRLHAGHTVVIVREQEGWALVRLGNRTQGWVPATAVEEIWRSR